ncbi:MAG: glycogen debranching protein GlgX [Deltaproteobacteria bacterium]|nr:glycogen debranching protein GlgX [Deltaproteobacteria bacterium]
MIDDDLPPLGATLTEHGTHFALRATNATGVELCLFDREDSRESLRVPMQRGSDGVYTRHVENVRAGQLYGLRVHGPFDPDRGHRFDASKVLLDPYARAVANEPRWSHELYSYDILASDLETAAVSHEDSARVAPKGVVIDPHFDWGDDTHPRTPWKNTVIYECHVKGMTARHPTVPEMFRGTYAGMSDPAVIAHLQSLGVTAVELMPIQEIGDERHLIARGSRNYWGYSTLGFFAPAGRYSASGRHGQQVIECKEMVRAMHRAGIEVLLDVVYNHTCEGNHLGATLSLRGVDNAGYYRLRETQKSRYEDVTGTGNSLDLSKPSALRLVLDSLRYWVQEFHIDGFRFDLAPALARGQNGTFVPESALFAAIANDPVLSRAKLIAEPWDLGPAGYRLGQFAHPMREWNGSFRDTTRRYWLARTGHMRDVFASRVAGSSDLFASTHRGATAGINFVTAHDGFTLRDLVSYARKHNERNGENNRDGTDFEHGDNHGLEGPTDRVDVTDARQRSARNMLVTLLLSLGVPMLSHGDEMLRTQGGNNNPYCLDDATSWMDWSLAAKHAGWLDWVRGMIALRKHLVPPRRAMFLRQGHENHGVADVFWFGCDGVELEPRRWRDTDEHTLGVLMSGALGLEDAVIWLCNPTDNDVTFTLPTRTHPQHYWTAVDTVSERLPFDARLRAHVTYTMAPRALVVLVGSAIAHTARADASGRLSRP